MLLIAQVDEGSIYPVGWTNDLGEANRAIEFLGPSYEIFKIPEIKGNFIMIRGVHEKKYPINVFSVKYSEIKSVTGEEVQDESGSFNIVDAHSKERVDELLSEMSRVSTHECR